MFSEYKIKTRLRGGLINFQLFGVHYNMKNMIKLLFISSKIKIRDELQDKEFRLSLQKSNLTVMVLILEKVNKRIMKDIEEINYHLSVSDLLFRNQPQDPTIILIQQIFINSFLLKELIVWQRKRTNIPITTVQSSFWQYTRGKCLGNS